MTVVKNLAFINKQRLKNQPLLAPCSINFSIFEHFPLDILHSFLPFNLKFSDESFVSISNKKINGFVTISKDGQRRVKLSKLLIAPDSPEIGKLLVNYVVNLYLSKGAEFFYVSVDKENLPLITMFKEGCGFSSFAKEIIYKIENSDFKYSNFDRISNITKMNFFKTEKVSEFINSTMFSYQRNIFKISSMGLKKAFFNGALQFFIPDFGYFKVLKINETDYTLDFAISPGSEPYLLETVRHIGAILPLKRLYVKLKSFYSNFQEINEIFDLNFKNRTEKEILVKTYLLPKKTDFSYGKMILNDAIPAF